MGYDKFEGLNQITDAYQKAVAKSLLINELGQIGTTTTGYELSHAKIGTSAWAFGGQQLDIGGNKDALVLIKDIATHEQIDWTASLEAALKSNDSSLLSSTDKFKIDNALSSNYGKEKINKSFISAVNNYTSHIDKVEIELQKIKPDLKLSDGEKLMLVDYQNQYPGGISLDSTSDRSLIVKMKEYIRIKGDITPEGLRDLFKTTKQYLDNKDTQGARIQKSYEAAKELDAQTENNQSNNDAQFMEDELDKFANNDKTSLDDAELTADSGQIKTDVSSSGYYVDEVNKTIYYFDEEGNPTQVTYDDNSDLLIYGDPANPNKIAFTDDNGDYQVWEKDINGNFVQTNKVDYSQVSNTAINQIGSLIIANNQNFSNIEKIAVSTSVATIADFATYKGSSSEFELQKDATANLQGAITSFAVSAYFAKNDNISDILGIDGTFIGNFADQSVSYAASMGTINLIKGKDFFNGVNVLNLAGAYVGDYLGHKIADNWIDTKNEAMGANVGSAIGSVVGASSSAAIGAWAAAELGMQIGAFAGPIGALIGALIGVIVGSLIGGLFGGDKAPVPTAKALFEFDEETNSYKLVSSNALDGGNKKVMVNIGQSLAKQLENVLDLFDGQLVDVSRMANIQVKQNDKVLSVNGFSGKFDESSNLIANALSVQIPFINVENGNEYLLRAINRTNEKFLSGNPDDLNRVNLNELYANITIAKEYSNYVNANPIILDKDGNVILNPEILKQINDEYQTILNIKDEKDKEKALNEFLNKYTFTNQKDYVDNLLKVNDLAKQDEINYWKNVLNIAKELRLDEHHYSEDFNKLNSEIAKYNYEIKEQNNQLLNVDYNKYLDDIKIKMLEVYNGNSKLNVSKDEAYNVLVEIGYNFNPLDENFQPKFEISAQRFNELLKLSNIANPIDNFKASEDAFSFAGKSLNDLQFKLENNSLIIKTLDKDLSLDIANEKSQTFTINNWSKWDKTNTNIELPDGTKINLQALLNLIGVKENQGFVDVNDAFKNILSNDETIISYLQKYDTKNIYVGTDSNDTIKAYYADNLIVTGNGENTIVTGTGDDIVFAHKGINNISAGLGNDTVSYEKSSEAVYSSLKNGGTSGISKGDTYIGVENLIGSKYDDALEGNKENNTLFGAAGNDILLGGAGSDTLDGGIGVDVASYKISDAIQINLKNNYATGGEATGDKFVNIEGISASDKSDAIVGDDNSNIIYANNGDDRISVNAGDDIVFGGNGNDYIKGENGSDTLYGEEGNDILIGGSGDDLLLGGNGKNTLIGDDGIDRVMYKGVSTDFQVMFYDERTIFVKSLDGKTLDTLKDIEELVFDDAVFEIDYENKALIKKAVFESYKDDTQPITTNNQSASIATAIAIGTVATAETKESSDITNYFDDPIKEEQNKTNKNQIVIPPLTKENPLYDLAQKIKEYKENSNTIIAQKTDETNNKGIYQLSTISKKDNEISPNSEIEQTLSTIVDTQTFKELVKKTTLIETTILPQDFVGNENLAPLIAPQITLNNTTIYEDNNLFGIEILNSNSNSALNVVFIGLPDTFSMSAGEKRADGNWYLSQNDLINLQMIPQTNNSDDFDLIVKVIVTDAHGRVIISQLTQTIEIIAVADTPNLSVENTTFGLEDTQIPLVISSSLVDTLGGVDGEESLLITIENVPLDAILSAGVRDTEGIWYLQQNELSGLKITPKLHDGDDFTVKVTAYAIESENNHIASISEEIFIEVYAIADTPILEVKDSLGDEDTQISLDITSNLVDDDGSEILTLTIEGIPNEAILNNGTKDENGVWYLTKEQLAFLTITPKLHDATDFIIKVTAKTQEKENAEIVTISKDILVKVNAIADNVNLDLFQDISGQDGVAIFTEDPGFAFIDIKSSFIDLDGSESIHYIIEGIPLGSTLTNGIELEQGKWKLMPLDLTNLSINLLENSDVNFSLKVTAITTESENQHQKSTTKYIDVQIESSADFTILNVSDAKGDENSFIDLNIQSSLIDNDGSETLEIIIEQVPSNAVLNKGIKDTNGVWHLTKDDLQGLQIRPEFNSIQTMELKVKAVSTEKKNGSFEESIAFIKIDINPLPSNANITVNQAQALEDNLCTLHIDVDTSDLKPLESLYLELEIPQNCILNNGEKLSDTKWKLSLDDLQGLNLKTPADFSGSFFVDIKSVIIKANGTLETSSITTKLPVDIIAVADKPILEFSDITANEDDLIYLNISSQLKDIDGSETLKIEIDGLPNEALLSVGTKVNNIWIVEQKDIESICLLMPENLSGDFTLNVKAKSTEKSNADKQEILKEINLHLNEVIDNPISHIVENSAEMSINDLEINVDYFFKDIINTTDSNDTIKAGGMGDVIHSKGGKDLIYGDSESGFINVNFRISTQTSLGNNQALIYEVQNLPQNEILIINDQTFDGNVFLNFPNQKEELNLLIVAKVVDINNTSTIIKTISLPLIINTQESAGNDYIDAGIGDDIIYAQDGNDIVLAQDGDDTLFGGDGDDFLSGGKGKDKFDGGKGDDFIVIDFEDLNVNDFFPLIVNGGSGFDTVKIDDTKGVSFDMALTNIEKFIGGDGDDSVIGSEYSDSVIGGKGSDVYYTLGGNDTIYIDNEDIKAQAGNFVDAGSGYDKIYINDSVGVIFDVSGSNAEEIHSGIGDDTIFASIDGNILDGNDGIDTISFIHSNGGVNVDLSTGISSGGFAQGDMIINFENIVGTNFDDVLVGNNQDNVFYAKKGNDSINGSSGYDNVVIDGSLKEFYDGKDLKNIITSFNLNATVITQYGITQMTNIEQITFDDYIIYLDGRSNSPIVYEDLITTQEDTAIQIDSSYLLDNDFTISSDNLRVLEVKNAVNGSVFMDENGKIIFTPNTNYNSSFNNAFDSNSALYKDNAGFKYVVVDDNGNKTTGYAKVNVNAVNDAPEVISHNFNRNSLYTGSGKFLINDVDSNMDAISVNVVSNLNYVTSYITNRKLKTKNVIGTTDINGRTVEDDGEFYFNYRGSYWDAPAHKVYEMRQFIVQIVDTGDILTGENTQSILYNTGINYHYVKNDPIVLDLDSDGIEIENRYYESFDETLTGVKGDDAIFFWDIDGDKKISSAIETDWTVLDENALNDLDILRTFFDSNKDGNFDINDNNWKEFALWQDKNNDGLMDENEYTNILDSNILKLNLGDTYSSKGDFPIDEYSTYTTKNNEEKALASAYIDTTMTPDKLILKEAMVLNEQLAILNPQKNEFYEVNTNSTIFDDEYQEENIA